MIIQCNDPFTGPSFSLSHRIRRQLWGIVWLFLFRPSPRPFHTWRNLLLKSFGAKIGTGCHVYPAAKIWAPWNLRLGNHVGVADGVNLYSMNLIHIGDYAVISQGAHLCGGTHDYNSANFQLITKPIFIGANAWVCADTFIHSGVVIPDGVVVGACSVVLNSLPQPWGVYAGNPCKQVGNRQIVKR